MTLTNVVPLVVAACLTVPIALAAVHTGVDRLLTRASIQIFGGYIDEFRREHPQRQQALRAAHLPVTYREYGSKTMLYAGTAAIVGSILGLYLIWAVLLVLAIDPETLAAALPGPLTFLANLGGLPALSAWELFGLFSVACFTIGAIVGTAIYWLRWWYPAYIADRRASRIETALPSTIAFVYALSRSGMSIPEVIHIVARQEETYGEAAAEFSVAVRHMDTFGVDVVTALQRMGRHSPSSQFGEFTENLVSVLQSGHSLSAFLERQYHDYQDEAESQQEQVLGLLGTLAEAYVTVLVAGPLFLITILIVIGIAVGGTFEPLQALIYVILPLGNLVFIIYLSMVTDSIVPGTATTDEPDVVAPGLADSRDRPQPDGGVPSGALPEHARETIDRLAYYKRLRATRDQLGNPLETLLERPNLVLAMTVPIALVVVLWELPSAVTAEGFDVAAIDDTIALAALFVLATFAICYELHRRRIDAIEGAVPDLLDRLASVNEAGTSIVLAIDHVRDSELGPLSAELDRVWADIQWGADLETALRRFDHRVRTRAVSRAVTVLTEAMNASGNLATVLRIAGQQAATDRRLKRERAQVMVEYMVVVYVAFFVFLFIVAVLSAYLLPNLPASGAGEAAEATAVEGLGGVSEADRAAYTTLFYHATLVQGVLSGLIAGQLSTGDVRAGAKHATVMVGLAVLLFAVVV
ncbi:type II secretion protein F [Salinadaptatus halalkaliphilus]|uniref:Type II secretion protein F n=1 Tax=Salinadaptatus halalkaliphilus TaxID=2419781 RepID=A0A4S3TG22_9EURY|nr:type II secretion system F family protein [Salinadaptatus halalkaliphilus]THE62796.1 type II secretion protein F [Salinadaptatus halalkaliphilus]